MKKINYLKILSHIQDTPDNYLPRPEKDHITTLIQLAMREQENEKF